MTGVLIIKGQVGQEECIEGRQCEDTERRQPSANQGKRPGTDSPSQPQKEPILLML